MRRSATDVLSAEQQTELNALLDELLDVPAEARAQHLRARATLFNAEVLQPTIDMRREELVAMNLLLSPK
jgi:hypothetical protein